MRPQSSPEFENIPRQSLMNSSLWAITCYFNPCQYKSRRVCYQTFRRHLQVPLVTVELSFSGDFHLDESDAEVMIRLKSKDVMWQKERLLNVAIEALPDSCDKVAWLDCDVVFENEDWPQAACEALQRHPVIQPFEYSYDLNRGVSDGCYSPEKSYLKCESLARGVAQSSVAEDIMQSTDKRGQGSMDGLAWAARRDLLERHLIYDACIVGGGDGAIVAGVLGNFKELTDYLMMNPRRVDHFMAWAESFHQEVAGDLGYIPGNIYHLWHGDIKDRNYSSRRVDLEQNEFDPYIDIAIDFNGCWRWNSDKQELHQFLRDYFASRFEDGRTSPSPTNNY
ncbi:MAG: hypothetical protein O7C75_04235 [Verrucomicrobia bacterium]|nr:hypothetical protein [Verrucomicrobiota bacterium]